MPAGIFPFEDCLLKHHIRTNAWLPICKSRLDKVRSTGRRRQRRLRYFTFCAVGAVDVLLLDVAKIISRSSSGKFDTVFFFERDYPLIVETQKRIPGGIGFPGEFLAIVNKDDRGQGILDEDDPLSLPDVEESLENLKRQTFLETRRRFIQSFPFDIMNLDLEGFVFRQNDPFPGRLVRALRKVFEWQQRPLPGSSDVLPGFSLMFTTQIGPPNLPRDYLQLLEAHLQTNINDDHKLNEFLAARAGTSDINKIRSTQFEIFFRLSMPKVIAAILMEKDWYVDDVEGIKLFEIERQSAAGPYRMLHLVMDVKRQIPPQNLRGPGIPAQGVEQAHRTVVQSLFQRPEVQVTDDLIDKKALSFSLRRIKARRRKYCPECE